jgi:hypothetical protein
MPRTEDQVQELVREMYSTADSIKWELTPEEIRSQRGQRRGVPLPDGKLLVLVAAVVILVVVGFVAASNGSSHKSTAADPATTTSSTPAGSIPVPSLVGVNQNQASNELDQAGLSLGSLQATASSQVPAGVVISQEPAPGVEVRPGSSIDLVVSTGTPSGGGSTLVTVPNTIGESQALASDALGTAGLNVGTVEVMGSSQIATGDVISQDPAPGTKVGPGTSVNLVVSKGA